MARLLTNLNNATLLKWKVNATSSEGKMILLCNDEHALLAYKKGLNALYSETIQASQPKSFQEARKMAESLVFSDQNQRVLHYRGNTLPQNNFQRRNNSNSLGRYNNYNNKNNHFRDNQRNQHNINNNYNHRNQYNNNG
ncbi:myb-like protein D [Teleopsis dalmanni]|uniref:myb-like protein D n=1 Tax=Teleopsis dalmanni TaxID=139649 RepID=UPI0018CE9E81|nr:myb-like protein D [Teleopsis dalmanni]XP_037944262.1 myb-like protein D [Teleopsis dalmanni]